MIDQPVKTGRCYVLYKTRGLISGADHVDNFISPLKAFQNPGNTFRRVLKVRVHTYDAIPPAVIQSGDHGGLVAEISGKADHLYVTVSCSKAFQYG